MNKEEVLKKYRTESLIKWTKWNWIFYKKVALLE